MRAICCLYSLFSKDLMCLIYALNFTALGGTRKGNGQKDTAQAKAWTPNAGT
jgi:hypothetical protein